MLSSAPLSDATCGLMPAILVPTISFSCLLVHVSRSCRRCALCLASLILYICLVICSSYAILSLPIVRSCVLLRVLKKYTIPPLVVCVSAFSFSFCCLGGIIVISGVRICKSSYFNCANTHGRWLQTAWVRGASRDGRLCDLSCLV